MKHLKQLLASFLLLAISSVYAHIAPTYIKEIQGEKIYVNPGYIYVANDGLFLNMEEGLVPLQTVHCDANGIYVDEAEAPVDGAWWTCPYCKWRNPWTSSRCRNPKCPTNQS